MTGKCICRQLRHRRPGSHPPKGWVRIRGELGEARVSDVDTSETGRVWDICDLLVRRAVCDDL